MAHPATTTAQLDAKLLLKTLRAFRNGDFSIRLPLDMTGVEGEIAEAFNDIVSRNETLTRELDRVATVVGKEGKIGERAKLPAATGAWNSCIDSVNAIIGDLVQPTTEVARVIGAVAKGDLGQTMQLEIEGRPLTRSCRRRGRRRGGGRVPGQGNGRKQGGAPPRLLRVGSDGGGPRVSL